MLTALAFIRPSLLSHSKKAREWQILGAWSLGLDWHQTPLDIKHYLSDTPCRRCFRQRLGSHFLVRRYLSAI